MSPDKTLASMLMDFYTHPKTNENAFLLVLSGLLELKLSSTTHNEERDFYKMSRMVREKFWFDL